VSVAGACGQPRNEAQHTSLVGYEKPNRRGAPPAVGKGIRSKDLIYSLHLFVGSMLMEPEQNH
jgi:hypothetical protein